MGAGRGRVEPLREVPRARELSPRVGIVPDLRGMSGGRGRADLTEGEESRPKPVR